MAKSLYAKMGVKKKGMKPGMLLSAMHSKMKDVEGSKMDKKMDMKMVKKSKSAKKGKK